MLIKIKKNGLCMMNTYKLPTEWIWGNVQKTSQFAKTSKLSVTRKRGLEVTLSTISNLQNIVETWFWRPGYKYRGRANIILFLVRPLMQPEALLQEYNSFLIDYCHSQRLYLETTTLMSQQQQSGTSRLLNSSCEHLQPELSLIHI